MQAGGGEGGEAAETFVRDVGIVDNDFALWQDWTALEFLVNISSCEVIVQPSAAGEADLVQGEGYAANTA